MNTLQILVLIIGTPCLAFGAYGIWFFWKVPPPRSPLHFLSLELEMNRLKWELIRIQSLSKDKSND